MRVVVLCWISYVGGMEMQSWPAAVVSFDDSLRRLRERLTSAEADLRQARACYDALLEAGRTCVVAAPTAAGMALTTQENRVANLVAAGMSNCEIAEALHVSVHTVKSHVKNMLEKLAIRSRWQLGAAIGQVAVASSRSEI
jgi:DNA-binding NarL/FixJ family response regulator